MNHTKTNTLGIAAAIVAVAAVLMVAATTTVLGIGHTAFAFGSKVKVGNTKTIAIQAADNSQHCSFGPGSFNSQGKEKVEAAPVKEGPGSSCDNHPDNHQDQTTNSGSTGTG